MSAGQRDKLVTIQRYTAATTESSGFPTEPWANLGQEWMKQRDIRGDERLHAGGMSAEFDTEWTLPYRSDMDPELLDVPKFRRLVYSGRTFDIKRAIRGDFEHRHKITLETIASTRV